jgi:hypothetical protein
MNSLTIASPAATPTTQFLQLSTFDKTSLIQRHSVDLQCLILSTAKLVVITHGAL